MIVIGITGLIGSGKDVIAAYLHEAHGYEVLRFSHALKTEVAARLPRTLLEMIALVIGRDAEWMGRQRLPASLHDLIHQALWNDRPPVFRALLQEYGTEIRRADDPDYWVKRLWESVNAPKIAIPDVRFPNEYASIRERAGYLVHVVRPGAERQSHASETSLDGFEFDAVFENTKDIQYLQDQVRAWLVETDLIGR